MTDVRLDKYLWVVRIYKTRSLALDECKKGHVLVNDIEAKPSKIVKIGDRIDIKQPPIIRNFTVLDISLNRVSAEIAKTLVKETTPEIEFLKLKLAKNTYVQRDHGTGRPTKKERRLIEKFEDYDNC